MAGKLRVGGIGGKYRNNLTTCWTQVHCQGA